MDVLATLFDTTGFPPRWYCGEGWTDIHRWTHIVADVSIFGAYTAIPCVLAFFVLRRRDVPFLPIFWLFAAFIFFCGFGHLVEATIFFQPWYRFSAAVKVCTAIASWATVLALVPILPKALALPGLALMNEKLKSEIVGRQAVANQLRQHAQEVERANLELERFSRNVLDREERVIALKEEVNALLQELGREPRYLRGVLPQLKPENSSV